MNLRLCSDVLVVLVWLYGQCLQIVKDCVPELLSAFHLFRKHGEFLSVNLHSVVFYHVVLFVDDGKDILLIF